MGAGLVLTCEFFILGGLLSPVTGIPGPILMIISVAVAKVFRVLPTSMEEGAYQFYRFPHAQPDLRDPRRLGTLFVPWKQMIDSLTFGYLMVCGCSVVAMGRRASSWASS
jgi:malate:Na+ symporter